MRDGVRGIAAEMAINRFSAQRAPCPLASGVRSHTSRNYPSTGRRCIAHDHLSW